MFCWVNHCVNAIPVSPLLTNPILDSKFPLLRLAAATKRWRGCHWQCVYGSCLKSVGLYFASGSTGKSNSIDSMSLACLETINSASWTNRSQLRHVFHAIEDYDKFLSPFWVYLPKGLFSCDLLHFSHEVLLAGVWTHWPDVAFPLVNQNYFC